MSISTLSSIDVCARVRARWIVSLPDHLRDRVDHNIALCIPGGCERLARSVKDTTDRRLLTLTIENEAPDAGVIDLTHADFASMLIDTFRQPGAINTFAPSSTVFNHVPSMDALKASTPVDPTCVWYHLQDQKRLVFKNPADNALNTYITPLSLTGVYIPDFGSATRPVVGELNDQLVDRVNEIVKQMGGLPFLTLDPDKATQIVGR